MRAGIARAREETRELEGRAPEEKFLCLLYGLRNDLP